MTQLFKYVKDLNMWLTTYQGYSHVRFNKYAKIKKKWLTCRPYSFNV